MKLQFSSLKAFKAFLAMQALGDNPVFTGNVNGWNDSDATQAYADAVAHIAYYKKTAAKRAHSITSVTIYLSDYEFSYGNNVYRLDVVVKTEPKV